MDSNNINKNEEKINHLNMILRLTIFTGLFVGIFVSIYYYFAQFSNSPYAELDNSNYQFILDNYEKYPSNKKMIFLISNFYSGNKVGINRKDYENYFDFLIDRKNEKGVQINSIININYMKINNYEDDKENAIRQSHYNKFAKLLEEYNQNEILKSDYLIIKGLLLEDDKELNNKIHAMLDDLKITIAEYNTLSEYIGSKAPISIKYTQDRDKNLNETIAKILSIIDK